MDRFIYDSRGERIEYLVEHPMLEDDGIPIFFSDEGDAESPCPWPIRLTGMAVEKLNSKVCWQGIGRMTFIGEGDDSIDSVYGELGGYDLPEGERKVSVKVTETNGFKLMESLKDKLVRITIEALPLRGGREDDQTIEDPGPGYQEL